MEAVALEAVQREKRSKGYLNALRRQGWVPGILYGNDAGEILIQIPAKELEQLLRSETGRNSIIDLKIKGKGGDKRFMAMLRDLQRNPVRGELTHADLYHISLKSQINTEVPLVLTGDSPGVAKGGVLQFTLRSVNVHCLPTEIPQHIDVDMGSLDIGDKITVGDLKVPKGVEILNEPDGVVVSVVAPRLTAEAEEAAPAPAEAGEEHREKVIAAGGERKTREE